MSLYDYTSPPEPEFSDHEWDYAHFQVCSELIRSGYSRAEAEQHADDLTVADRAEFNQQQRRDDDAAEWADQLIKRRKEGL